MNNYEQRNFAESFSPGNEIAASDNEEVTDEPRLTEICGPSLDEDNDSSQSLGDQVTDEPPLAEICGPSLDEDNDSSQSLGDQVSSLPMDFQISEYDKSEKSENATKSEFEENMQDVVCTTKCKKKASKKPSETKKARNEDLFQICSEGQRLLRDSKIKVPYHVPPQRSIQEFVGRKRSKISISSQPFCKKAKLSNSAVKNMQTLPEAGQHSPSGYVFAGVDTTEIINQGHFTSHTVTKDKEIQPHTLQLITPDIDEASKVKSACVMDKEKINEDDAVISQENMSFVMDFTPQLSSFPDDLVIDVPCATSADTSERASKQYDDLIKRCVHHVHADGRRKSAKEREVALRGFPRKTTSRGVILCTGKSEDELHKPPGTKLEKLKEHLEIEMHKKKAVAFNKKKQLEDREVDNEIENFESDSDSDCASSHSFYEIDENLGFDSIQEKLKNNGENKHKENFDESDVVDLTGEDSDSSSPPDASFDHILTKLEIIEGAVHKIKEITIKKKKEKGKKGRKVEECDVVDLTTDDSNSCSPPPPDASFDHIPLRMDLMSSCFSATSFASRYDSAFSRVMSSEAYAKCEAVNTTSPSSENSEDYARVSPPIPPAFSESCHNTSWSDDELLTLCSGKFPDSQSMCVDTAQSNIKDILIFPVMLGAQLGYRSEKSPTISWYDDNAILPEGVDGSSDDDDVTNIQNSGTAAKDLGFENESPDICEAIELCSGTFSSRQEAASSSSEDEDHFKQNYSDEEEQTSDEDDYLQGNLPTEGQTENIGKQEAASSSSEDQDYFEQNYSDEEEEQTSDEDDYLQGNLPTEGQTENIGKETVADFFDEEAELSGEDNDEEEEDEGSDNDAEDEFEFTNEAVPSEEELREQVGKIHNKKMMEEDKRKLLWFEEKYLEDGDLHTDGTGRKKQFIWKNQNDAANEVRTSEDSSSDEEFEQKRREEQLEKRKFIEEQQVNTEGMEFQQQLATDNDVKYCVLNKEQVIVEVVEDQPKCSSIRMVSKTSFISRGKGLLNSTKDKNKRDEDDSFKATKSMTFAYQESDLTSFSAKSESQNSCPQKKTPYVTRSLRKKKSILELLD